MTRLATLKTEAGPRLVSLTDDGVIDVAERLERLGIPAGSSLEGYIAGGPQLWNSAREVLRQADGAALPWDESDLLAPLHPGAIICGGANFHDHLRETGRAKPDRVEFFFKSPTTVIGPRDDVRMDPRLSAKYDYEVELGIIIGRAARNVPAADALSHVFGYCVVNDVSIRDHQIVLDDDGTSHGRFGQGKTFQDACPLGPWVVTSDELGDPSQLRLSTTVGGELRQQGAMDDAIWSVPDLVAYYSSVLTLQPGWVIAAGTPGGPALGSDVELRADPYRRQDGVQRGGYVQAGQVVVCRIDGIGALANRYVVEE